jgi:hypothetical protein
MTVACLVLCSNAVQQRSQPDNGKLVVRRGRKATGQIFDLTAGLPKAGESFSPGTTEASCNNGGLDVHTYPSIQS